jgi:predicted acetyltransferase
VRRSILPDGTSVPRLPGIVRWMWDGEFAGMIGFRWQVGTAELPPTCLGHIGFNVPPSKLCRGYATAGLAAILPEARRVGLPYAELTTTPDNLASQRVIEKGGGVLVERRPPAAAIWRRRLPDIPDHALKSVRLVRPRRVGS